MSDKRISYDSRRGQEVFIVLFALDDLGGIHGRREVIDHISREHWYALIGDDLAPTPTSTEARYRIDLAWARKDGVLKEFINNLEWNSWELNRRGHDCLDRAIAAFRSGKWDVRRCEYFTLTMKRRILPGFEPRDADRKRVSFAALLEYA